MSHFLNAPARTSSESSGTTSATTIRNTGAERVKDDPTRWQDEAELERCLGTNDGSSGSLDLVSQGKFLCSGSVLRDSRSETSSSVQDLNTSMHPAVRSSGGQYSIGADSTDGNTRIPAAVHPPSSNGEAVSTFARIEDNLPGGPSDTCDAIYRISGTPTVPSVPLPAILPCLQSATCPSLPSSAAIETPYQQAPLLTLAVAGVLLEHLHFTDYKALRETCRNWSHVVTQARPLRFPAAYHMPAEMIEQLYAHLSPTDFNAARHTCSRWFTASLSTTLLTTQLKRDGWWSSTLHDWKARHPFAPEWFLSCRLSRECALSAKWTGNGLRTG
ncbi:hypothetical protein LTR28_009721 [Elasticomyces elasticus]|nr:hypothetical protein LTR28_009721 [Elasticomyces elasticus]